MAELRRAGRGIPAGQASTERGMVTAELALASLGAAALTVLLAWVLTVVMLLVRCQGAATGVARQEARGDHVAAEAVMDAAPNGAEVAVRRERDQITVRVSLAARPWAAWLPSVPLTASATVLAEPS